MKPLIIITIEGGIPSVRSTIPVEVHVLDHDNASVGERSHTELGAEVDTESNLRLCVADAVREDKRRREEALK